MPIYARHQRSELHAALGHPLQKFEKLSQSYSSQIAESDRHHERLRIFFVGAFFVHAFNSALFSAISYFRYLEIWQSKIKQEDSGHVYEASLDLAHHFADTVPIDLYNAAEILSAPETILVFEEKAAQLKIIFNAVFPYLVEARDAVCHYHDRDMGRNRSKQVSGGIGGRPITPRGKEYVSRHGEAFEFRFEIKQFEKFLTHINQVMS